MISVPLEVIVLPLVLMVGLGSFLLSSWIMDRWIDPWVRAKIDQHYEQKLAELHARWEELQDGD